MINGIFIIIYHSLSIILFLSNVFIDPGVIKMPFKDEDQESKYNLINKK